MDELSTIGSPPISTADMFTVWCNDTPGMVALNIACPVEFVSNSTHQLNSFYFAIYGILMTVLITLGTVGNILAIVVLCSPRLWTSVTYYLLALALWDTALLLTSFVWWSYWSLYYQGATRLFGEHVEVLRVAYMIGNTTITGTIWTVVCITINRYVAILYPLKHRLNSNGSRAKLVLCFISLAAILFNITRMWELETITVECCNEDNHAAIVKYLEPTELRAERLYFLFYRVIGSVVFLYLLPCTILAVLTVRMCLALESARKRRKAMKEGKSGARLLHQTSLDKEKDTISRTEAKTNRMLTMVLVKFLLCYLLPTINDVLELVFPESDYYSSEPIETMIVCSNALVVFNSSCNFFIYFATGRRFRNELLHLLRHWRYSKTKPKIQSYCNLLNAPQTHATANCNIANGRSETRLNSI